MTSYRILIVAARCLCGLDDTWNRGTICHRGSERQATASFGEPKDAAAAAACRILTSKKPPTCVPPTCVGKRSFADAGLSAWNRPQSNYLRALQYK